MATLCVFAYATLYGHLPANFWIFRCDASLYSAEHYVGYCGHPAFGDYYHGAIYLQTEPRAVENLRRASVLFFGNSRAQMVFSAQAIESFFAGRGQRYFNLALNGEMDLFPRLTIRRLDLHPRIVVAGADYFFYDAMSPVAQDVTSGTERVRFEYAMKARVQDWHRTWCGPDERGTLAALICGSDPLFALYTSRVNGRTAAKAWPDSQEIPATADAPYPAGLVPQLIANARDFQDFLRERGTCLVIAAIPWREVNAQAVQDVADAIGAPFVAVDDSGLTTYDGSHMDVPSRELWAERFLRGFPAAERACEDMKP